MIQAFWLVAPALFLAPQEVLRWHGSPSGFLYAVLLAIMMKVPHPQPVVMEPLGTKRIVIAIITLIVFALCFWPFPITIT